MIKSQYQQNSLRFTPTWDFTKAKAAVASANQGSFYNASTMIDAMLADDRVAATLDTRVNAILGLQPTFAGDERATLELEGGLYWDIFPEDVLRDILVYGIMLGVAPVEVVYDTGESWQPALIPWHPQNLSFNERDQSYYLQTMTSQVELDDEAPFVLFTPGGSRRPWLKGLYRRLMLPFLIRQFTPRDWARWSEKHGLATTLARVPSRADDTTRESFFNSLINIHSEGYVELVTDEQGNGFDLELLEAAAQSWQGFEHLWNKVDSTIDIAILGQNLTTEVTGGSLAAAKVHNQVRMDYLKADLALLSTFEHMVLTDWYELNFDGPDDEVPWVHRQIQTQPTDVEIQPHHLTTGAIRKNELRASLGLDPLDAEDGGEDFITLQQAEQTQLTALASGDRAPSGFVSGQRYADQLVGRTHTADPLDVKSILGIIQSSNSPEQLRNRLTDYYRNASPDELQESIERSLILAELAGRYAVLEDL